MKHTGDNRPSRDSNKSRVQNVKLDCVTGLLLAAHRKLDRLLAKQEKLMSTVDNVEREVKETRAAANKLIALAQEQRRKIQELIDAGGQVDPARLQAIVDESDATQAEIEAELPEPPPE